jgi:hypothetical protein
MALSETTNKIKKVGYNDVDHAILKKNGFEPKGFWFSKNGKMVKKEEIEKVLNSNSLSAVGKKIEEINEKLIELFPIFFNLLELQSKSFQKFCEIMEIQNENNPNKKPLTPRPDDDKSQKIHLSIIGKILGIVGLLYPMVITVFKKLVNWVRTSIADAIKPLTKFINSTIEIFAKYYSTIITGVSSAVSFMVGKAADVLDSFSSVPVVGKIAKKWATSLRGVATATKEIGEKASETVTSAAASAESTVSSVGSSAESFVRPPAAPSASAGPLPQMSGGKQATASQMATRGERQSPGGQEGVQRADYSAPAGAGKQPKNVSISPQADLSSVEPGLLSRFYEAAEEYKQPLTINTGFRGDEYQATLWVRANILHEPGIFSPASPKSDTTVTYKGQTYTVKGSGKGSAHRFGQAIDVSPTAPKDSTSPLDPIFKKHGLWRPFIHQVGRTKSDPPHVQLDGQMGADQAEGEKFMAGKTPGRPAPKVATPITRKKDSTEIAKGPSIEKHFGAEEPQYGSSTYNG